MEVIQVIASIFIEYTTVNYHSHLRYDDTLHRKGIQK